jgi:hypothetical protein
MDIKALLAALQQAQAEAKAANLRRYSEIDAGYSARKNEVTGLIDQLGASTRADITRRNAASSSSAAQDMTSRGLTGTTIKPTVQQGYDRDLLTELTRHDNEVAINKGNIISGLDRDQLQFQERRDDVGPDLSMYAQLLSQAGQSNGSMRTTSSSRLLSGGSSPAKTTSMPVTRTLRAPIPVAKPKAPAPVTTYAPSRSVPQKPLKDQPITYLWRYLKGNDISTTQDFGRLPDTFRGKRAPGYMPQDILSRERNNLWA